MMRLPLSCNAQVNRAACFLAAPQIRRPLLIKSLPMSPCQTAPSSLISIKGGNLIIFLDGMSHPHLDT